MFLKINSCLMQFIFFSIAYTVEIYLHLYESGQSNLTKRPHHRRTLTVQLYLPRASVDLHLIHASLCPQVNRHLDRFSHFAELVIVTDRQTDNAAQSVTIGYICVCSTANTA